MNKTEEKLTEKYILSQGFNKYGDRYTKKDTTLIRIWIGGFGWFFYNVKNLNKGTQYISEFNQIIDP